MKKGYWNKTDPKYNVITALKTRINYIEKDKSSSNSNDGNSVRGGGDDYNSKTFGYSKTSTGCGNMLVKGAKNTHNDLTKDGKTWW